ncbi:hypothetical protein Tco_1062746 [Tanacetum coccineum]
MRNLALLDTSECDNDYDLPLCGDFSPINISEEKSVTFSNPLFDLNDDFTSSDDESLSDKDSALLVTPLSDFNVDECFDPGGDVDEIDFLLHRDPSTPKMSVVSILKGFTDEPALEENDDLFNLESKDNEWKKILYDAPIDDLMAEDKVFNPGIHDKKISPTYVSLTFEDRHYISFTYVIQIFLPYFTYPVNSSLPLSSRSEDVIFDLDISTFHFSSLKPVAYEFPMEVCSSMSFVLNIMMIWGEIAPDYEDSRARDFVHHPLDLQSFACLYIWESDILDLIDLTFIY